MNINHTDTKKRTTQNRNIANFEICFAPIFIICN